MQVGIFASREELIRQATSYIIDRIEYDPASNIGVPTGATPDGFFDILRDAHATTDFSLEEARVFSLDEYVCCEGEKRRLFREMLVDNLVGDDNTGLLERNLITPDPTGCDLLRAADDFEKTLKSFGGIDLQLLGIGSDGHVAFNEPGGSLMSRSHIDFLTPQSKRDAAHYFGGDPDKVPEKCITQGLATIMEARRIILVAMGKEKAGAVKSLVEGCLSQMCPATVLQMHTKCTVLLDEDAASELLYADHYRLMWERRNSEPVF